MLAAAACGRRYLGIELEQKYCGLIRNRLGRIERRPAVPVSGSPDYESPADQAAVAALGDLYRFLRQDGYHDLARTVRLTMDEYGV